MGFFEYVFHGRLRRVVPTIFISMLVSISVAQEEVELEAVLEEAPKRYFSVMAYGDDLFQGITFVNADEEREELQFRPDRRSVTYACPQEAGKVVFFREILDEKGVSTDVTVAEADLSEVGERALIVFSVEERPSAAYPYRLYVADESAAVFGGGSFRFLNICETPLYWRVGGESSEFPTGFSSIVSFPAEDRSPIPIALAVRLSDQWKIVFSTRTQSHPDLGTLFVVKPPLAEDSLHVRVHALRDRLAIP